MKVHIVQHGLINAQSHYYMETLGWKRLFEQRGIVNFLYSNRAVDNKVRQALGVIPCFNIHPDIDSQLDPIINKLGNLMDKSESMKKALTAIELTGVCREDLLILPYCREAEICGVGKWLQTLPETRKPRVAFIIHRPDFDFKIQGNHGEQIIHDAMYYRYAAHELRKGTDINRIGIFTAFNDKLRQVLAHISDLPTYDGPHDMYYQQAAEIDRDIALNQHDVAVLGQFRQEKGSALVPSVYQSLVERNPSIKLLLQVDRHECFAEVDHWATPLVKSGNLTLHKGTMSMDQYAQAFKNSTLILLPYLWHRYHLRGSGLLTESLAYGKPCIVPKDSVMAEQLIRSNSPGVVFEQFDTKSIVDAVEQAYQQRDQLTDMAQRNVTNWRQQHSVESCFDFITSKLAH